MLSVRLPVNRRLSVVSVWGVKSHSGISDCGGGVGAVTAPNPALFQRELYLDLSLRKTFRATKITSLFSKYTTWSLLTSQGVFSN